jgi:hypothetical protein
LRNKKREYLKDKINELAPSSKNKNIRDLYRVIEIRSFENMSQLKYLGTRVTNEIFIKGEFKKRLNSGSGCFHSGQNLLSSRLLSSKLKIRIYRTVILPVVL